MRPCQGRPCIRHPQCRRRPKFFRPTFVKTPPCTEGRIGDGPQRNRKSARNRRSPGATRARRRLRSRRAAQPLPPGSRELPLGGWQRHRSRPCRAGGDSRRFWPAERQFPLAGRASFRLLQRPVLAIETCSAFGDRFENGPMASASVDGLGPPPARGSAANLGGPSWKRPRPETRARALPTSTTRGSGSSHRLGTPPQARICGVRKKSSGRLAFHERGCRYGGARRKYRGPPFAASLEH